ncbi:MAG: radical SAM protein [Candidatus Woesearchaeota archaeon]
MSKLVAVVEREASHYAEQWFHMRPGARDNVDTVRIETPIGQQRIVTGTVVPVDLSYITSEYFYLDVTNRCNFACSMCGVKGDLIRGPVSGEEKASYLTDEFVDCVAEGIKEYLPWLVGHRIMFYGGGEPLVDPDQFARIHHSFDDVENTTRVVITNGLSLPISEDGLLEFLDRIGNPFVMITYSEDHANHYEALAGNGLAGKYIPDVSPEQALVEKIRLLNDHAIKNGFGFSVNAVYPNGHPSELDLRDMILQGALKNSVMTCFNGRRDPCSQNKETSIRFNGDVYPHCYDIFTKNNKLGIIGILRE